MKIRELEWHGRRPGGALSAASAGRAAASWPGLGRARSVEEVEENALDAGAEIEAFLRDIEARAYRIALVSVRDRDDALDIVQDAMIRLVRRYARRPSEEWRPLFYRILQNLIRDLRRRRGTRSKLLCLFGGFGDGRDPIDEAPLPASENPLERASAENAMQALEEALRTLPERQREAFMLRNFEGLDVAATATAMGCTEGSVKTHYSRAVHRLRELLRAHEE